MRSLIRTPVGRPLEQVVARYNAGQHSQQISEELKIRLGYVHELVARARRVGLVMLPAPRRRSVRVDEVVRLYRAGVRSADIAPRLQISPGHVRMLLSRARADGRLGAWRLPGESERRCSLCRMTGHDRSRCALLIPQ